MYLCHKSHVLSLDNQFCNFVIVLFHIVSIIKLANLCFFTGAKVIEDRYNLQIVMQFI